MNPDIAELEKYYNRYFALFKTEGWQQLMEDIKADALRLNDLQNAESERDLYTKQGQIKSLAWILNLEDTCERTWEDIQQQAKEDAA